ncbi:hypothetical protein GCK32_007877 [Trichostrongylus colubriformis]|uniref:Tyrosine-protein phosphatase domain-containing protein n=1 Tax=Trichostrongylus colubriformis TaxID=6319 RepID=A0AAN8G383_TRICO
MKRVNDFTQMKEFVAQNAFGRNRYKDVGCLDNRRVIVRIGNVSYIHANYVATPNHPKRFICTQAPLPKTCYEFWNMTVQEKSASILMLCNFIEMNVKKCAEYFPMDPGGSLDFDGVRVVCKKQDYFQFPIETKVQVRMTHLDVFVPGYPVHSCIHYHWLDWPDRGVPEADLTPVALLSKLKNSSSLISLWCLSATVFSQKYGPPGPLSSHFVDWLIANGYESDNFDRPDVGPNGSFGGKKRATEHIRNEPVIFIHGNGDAALHTQAPLATGWSRSIQYFLEQNYTEGELYATTWGDAWGSGSVLDSYSTMHTCSNLLFLRRSLHNLF